MIHITEKKRLFFEFPGMVVDGSIYNIVLPQNFNFGKTLISSHTSPTKSILTPPVSHQFFHRKKRLDKTATNSIMTLKKKRPIKVCNFCRKRKIRCDKNSPCSSCVKFGNEKCEYGFENDDDVLMGQLASLNSKVLKISKKILMDKTESLLNTLLNRLDQLDNLPTEDSLNNLSDVGGILPNGTISNGNGSLSGTSISSDSLGGLGVPQISMDSFTTQPMSSEEGAINQMIRELEQNGPLPFVDNWSSASSSSSDQLPDLLPPPQIIEPVPNQFTTFSMGEFLDDVNLGEFRAYSTQQNEIASREWQGIVKAETPEIERERSVSIADYFMLINKSRTVCPVKMIHFSLDKIKQMDKALRIFCQLFYLNGRREKIFNRDILPKFDNLDLFLTYANLEDSSTTQKFKNTRLMYNNLSGKIKSVLPRLDELNKMISFYFEKIHPFVPILEEFDFETEVFKLIRINNVDIYEIESISILTTSDLVTFSTLLQILGFAALSPETEWQNPDQYTEIAEICLEHVLLSNMDLPSIHLGILSLFYRHISPHWDPPDELYDLMSKIVDLAYSLGLKPHDKLLTWVVELNLIYIVHYDKDNLFYKFFPDAVDGDERVYLGFAPIVDSTVTLKFYLRSIDVFNCKKQILKILDETEQLLSHHDDEISKIYNMRSLLVLKSTKLSVMYQLYLTFIDKNEPNLVNHYYEVVMNMIFNELIPLIRNPIIKTSIILVPEFLILCEKVLYILTSTLARLQASESRPRNRELFFKVNELSTFVVLQVLEDFGFTRKYYKAWKIDLLHREAISYLDQHKFGGYGFSDMLHENTIIRQTLKLMQKYVLFEKQGLNFAKSLEPTGLGHVWTLMKQGNLSVVS